MWQRGPRKQGEASLCEGCLAGTLAPVSLSPSCLDLGIDLGLCCKHCHHQSLPAIRLHSRSPSYLNWEDPSCLWGHLQLSSRTCSEGQTGLGSPPPTALGATRHKGLESGPLALGRTLVFPFFVLFCFLIHCSTGWGLPKVSVGLIFGIPKLFSDLLHPHPQGQEGHKAFLILPSSQPHLLQPQPRNGVSLGWVCFSVLQIPFERPQTKSRS